MNSYLHQPKKFPAPIDLDDYYILREQQDKDLPDFFRYYSDPAVNQYILAEIPANLEDARHEFYYWKNVFYRNDGIYFAITTKHDDRMIGTIGLTSYNSYNNRIELSYDMAQEFWRKGIMTKAVQAVLKYGFTILNVNRIEAVTSIYNEASVRLLEKCNLQYEGRLRQHRYHRGKLVDVYMFSILREEFLLI